MAELTIHDTNCCAIQEIGDLRYYIRCPRNAMVDFCKENVLKRVRYRLANGNQGTIYSYYLFTARVDDPKTPTYGTQFAQFIEENDLGKVWASPILKNTAFHEGNWNQVWIWTPNHKNILKWWSEQEESKPVKVVAKSGVKAGPRPENPGGKDICPRCNKSWYEHTGWRCKDGGTWPDGPAIGDQTKPSIKKVKDDIPF